MRRWCLLVALIVAGCGKPPEPPPATPPPAPTTAPAPEPARPEPLRFVAYGDCRSNPDIHRQVVDRMLTVEPKPELILQTGDLVGDGEDLTLWEEALEIIAPLREFADYYVAMGNHDRGVVDLAGQFDLPTEDDRTYYTFVRGHCRFVVLDTNTIRHPGDPEQLAWLEATLAAADEEHVFVALHHPPFCIGVDYGPGDSGVRQRLHPILKAHPPRAVFCGHDHGYYRTVRDGVTYLVTAGGGAPLYDQDPKLAQPGDVYVKAHHFVSLTVDGPTVTAEVVALDGTVIETFQLPPSG